jgi:hypothetical protein
MQDAVMGDIEADVKMKIITNAAFLPNLTNRRA